MAKIKPSKKGKLLEIHVKYKVYPILWEWIKTPQETTTKNERRNLSSDLALMISPKSIFLKQNDIEFIKAPKEPLYNMKAATGAHTFSATLLSKSSDSPEMVIFTWREFQIFYLGKVGFSCCSSDLSYIWRTLL